MCEKGSESNGSEPTANQQEDNSTTTRPPQDEDQENKTHRQVLSEAHILLAHQLSMNLSWFPPY